MDFLGTLQSETCFVPTLCLLTGSLLELRNLLCMLQTGLQKERGCDRRVKRSIIYDVLLKK